MPRTELVSHFRQLLTNRAEIIQQHRTRLFGLRLLRDARRNDSEALDSGPHERGQVFVFSDGGATFR